ncbi:MAG: right-handed parallel beta-helix repeat-containing protein [Rikenellaceae bacterium]
MKLDKLRQLIGLIIIMLFSNCTTIPNVEEIKIISTDGDMTTAIRNALESASSSNVKIVLQKDGIYNVSPEYAYEEYCSISNHNNGSKKIIFPLKGFDRVEIEGNGSIIMCDGRLFPFLFEDCNHVTVRDLTIDWATPFLFYGEVIDCNQKQGWCEIKPLCDPNSWSVSKGGITFPNSHGYNFKSLGAALPFDPINKNVVNGAVDHDYSEKAHIEKLRNGNVRIYDKMSVYPPIGSTLNAKGDKTLNRYAPAFDFKGCRDITIDNVTIHHALGMGFLFERSEDIKILNSNIILPEGSNRVVSTVADASHFASCRGDILVDNCVFENMLDDGVNVHGVYLKVVDIIDAYSVNVVLQHYQQHGFNFAEAGDEMWFILQPSSSRQFVNRVRRVDTLNETIMTLTFDNPIPSELKNGDCVENKSWNPTFTMRNSAVRNNRARGIVLKTPLKTVIDDNTFSSMMSAILFRGESLNWFESGAVQDVLIQNNYILNSANCGTTHAALYITPRLGATYDSTELYDRNIRFIDNTINSSNPRVVIADRVENLQISGNEIIINNDAKAYEPEAPMFELINCKDVIIEKNIYSGAKIYAPVLVEEQSNNGLIIRDNVNMNLQPTI